MKLGVITDIHEEVDLLRAALAILSENHVDQIVVVGDLCAAGEQIHETCRQLAAVRALGVWGNHDLGLCIDVDEEMRARYSPEVITYMGSLRPRLEVGGCHFAHVEPWLDPENIVDLWYFEGPPDNQRKLARIFAAVPHRIIFAGHYHQWLLAKPDGIQPWRGQASIKLDDGRYFVVVGALCEGRFATFDTDTAELTPFQLV